MPAKRIEDVINDVLKGDAQQNALDFVAYLRANDIPIQESEAYWDIQYKGKSVCFLWIDGADQAPGPWTIWSDQEPGTWINWPEGDGSSVHKDFALNEHTKEIVWAHVNHCASCGSDCSPGKRKTVLGKAFDNLCGSALAFANPDAEALECAKKMVDMRKRDIVENL